MNYEKRKFTRIIINQMIKISFGRENDIHVSAGNLSEGGILCICDQYIDPYTTIFLMFEIPEKNNNNHISCEGIVLRSEKLNDKFETALEFSNIREEDRTIIKKFIKGH